MQQPKLFFPALTGLRAIAAWMIFIYHFFPFNNPSKYPSILYHFIEEFHIGVDIFFVLSGFLITYRYFDQDPIDFKKYMMNRVARIYPMYFLITIAVFLVYFIQNNSWDSNKTLELFLSLTMSKALFMDFILGGIPQGWTLTLEEMFYFTAPFYFILIKKNKNYLWLLLFAVFGVYALLKYLFNFEGNRYGFLQTNIHTYVSEFFAGIALAYIIIKNKIKSKGYWTYFGITIILMYLLTRGYLKDSLNLKQDFNRFIELIILGFVGVAPTIYGLIYEKTIIQNILSHKYMIVLGKSSYIFYLIHKGFIPVFINDYISDNKLLIFVLLNIISILLFNTMEEPLNNYIRKLYNKKNLNVS